MLIVKNNECGLYICIYVKCNETTFAINMCINKLKFWVEGVICSLYYTK